MSQAGYKTVEEHSGRMSPRLALVHLNVGGERFCTSVGTLTKFPESKLAEWFSGPPKLPKDSQGHYFLDRDGEHFGAVLEFLRSERVPVCNIPQVHKESVRYNITALTKRLEESPELFGEMVGRQQFLARVPHYKENIEETDPLLPRSLARWLAAENRSILSDSRKCFPSSSGKRMTSSLFQETDHFLLPPGNRPFFFPSQETDDLLFNHGERSVPPSFPGFASRKERMTSFLASLPSSSRKEITPFFPHWKATPRLPFPG
ncbi:uncharacterized protein kctd14 isoform X2 [Phyllopteryx taeniolatus]|uniref:uncharacterized protein kctd14 isoform X2 n=1 Tax=Phyllopteryx taeniolatus TaxID=161469 RepID=UPI002AD2FB39|nr:uncharacterized protein kctd14 isoform X2 [Phyllopteryx taeniolatus]